jgi:hypothetical protein
LVKVDIEKDEIILIDKMNHDDYLHSWIVKPEEGDQKAQLKKVPYCLE